MGYVDMEDFFDSEWLLIFSFIYRPVASSSCTGMSNPFELRDI